MVYAYLRVSTDKQDGQNQRLGIEALATARGLTIDEYIDDEGKSGTLEPEKRELGKLLKKLKSGDILLAGEISRLGRSLFMVFRILEYCLNNGITIMTAKDGYTLGNDIQSKVMAFAFGLSAEIERDMISRRTKEALETRKQKGMILGRHKGQVNSKHKLDSKLDEIKKMNDEGVSLRQMEKILKVNRNTISRFMFINNITPYRTANAVRRKDLDLRKIKKMFEDGLSLREVATEMGTNTIYIGMLLKRYKYLLKIYQKVQNAKILQANGSLCLSKENMKK